MTPRPSWRPGPDGGLVHQVHGGGGDSHRSHRPARPVVAPVRRSRFDLLPYLLVAPVMIFIAGLALVPAVFTVVQSFYKVDALDPPTRFDGLGNFRRLANDHAVLGSIANTGLYVVIGVTLSTLLGIGVAVVLQKPFRGRSLVIAVLILPWALPGVVEGILWTGIFDPNAGPDQQRARRRFISATGTRSCSARTGCSRSP